MIINEYNEQAYGCLTSFLVKFYNLHLENCKYRIDSIKEIEIPSKWDEECLSAINDLLCSSTHEMIEDIIRYRDYSKYRDYYLARSRLLQFDLLIEIREDFYVNYIKRILMT